MKKLYLLSFLSLALLSSVHGQTNFADIKKENENLKSELTQKKADVIVLEKNIQYLKETLNLIDSKISADDKDVTFKLNSVSGDSKTGKVSIEGVF